MNSSTPPSLVKLLQVYSGPYPQYYSVEFILQSNEPPTEQVACLNFTSVDFFLNKTQKQEFSLSQHQHGWGVLETREGNAVKQQASKHVLLQYFIEHMCLALDASIYLYLVLDR